ncbi:MAG: hypothetical protein KDJ42_05730 [Alphaproteobacteria bacterium]|nr:hypothetical protein [Alphaproteobacteria bacterium]
MRHYIILFFALALGVFCGTTRGYAVEIAPQPCDPNYWTTLKERAWMEAEREIMQNQNLIFKPDSVLEYTCFDKYVSHGAKWLGDIFVHTYYFGKQIIKRGEHPHAQEIALQLVVTNALKEYLKGSFQYEFFAERSPLLRNPPGITNSFPITDATTMKSYSCKVMKEVWKAAKCINFIDGEPFKISDGLHPFITLKPGPEGGETVPGYDVFGDVRKWPEYCDDPIKGQEWVDANKIAINENDMKYKFEKPLKKAYEDVRKMVEPGSCVGTLETGVMVILSGTKEQVVDNVCTNPGCTYLLDGKINQTSSKSTRRGSCR